MRIILTQEGPSNDAGARFVYTARVRVQTDEEAQLAGQTFARLCHALSTGATDWQGAAFSTHDGDT